MSQPEPDDVRSWTDPGDAADLARIRSLWADADTVPSVVLGDLLEIAHDQLTGWLNGREPAVSETSKKIAELYVAIDQWSSLRGGQAQMIGPEGFPVTVSTWNLVLKARDLLIPATTPASRLG